MGGLSLLKIFFTSPLLKNVKKTMSCQSNRIGYKNFGYQGNHFKNLYTSGNAALELTVGLL